MNDQIHAGSFYMTKLKVKNNNDIKKTILSEIRKWGLFKSNIFIINKQISNYYCQISLGDYDVKKKSFIRLYYLKMLKHHIYLKIYHYNIKKISSNEKLLCYFESILVPNGFEPSKW